MAGVDEAAGGQPETKVNQDEAFATDWVEEAFTSTITESEYMGDPEARRPLSREELSEMVVRLRLELCEVQATADALPGVAVARFTGRAYAWKGKWLHLAVVDSEGAFQRIIVQVPDEEDREILQVGLAVELICHYHGGRPILESILLAEENEDPMPELLEIEKKGRVPDWFDSGAKNAKRDLLKASDGSSSVSDLKVHLVWATKRRKKIITAPMVERMKILAEVIVNDRGLGKLLALNAESDHVHVALWLPNTVSASQVAGVLKARLSKALREEFPELVTVNAESTWQRGFFCGSIGSGGDLSTVLKYIETQAVPGADEGGDDEDDE